jgi:hypothetical protein
MPLESYDPHRAPDPDEWLALDEGRRRTLVMDYHRQLGHRQAGIDLQKEALHAVTHVAIENQVAMAGEMLPIQIKLRQLMAQGLDRHTPSTLSAPP